MKTCENCGCRVYNGACVNCHEEVFILEQYDELGMERPSLGSEFMKSVRKHESEIEQNNNR